MHPIAQLFITCLIDSLFPHVGEAVVEVLRRAGTQVAFPSGQTCCGQPAYNAGFHEQAVRMAQSTIDVFSGTLGPIVVPSGSCAAMLRYGYQELFAEDPIWLPRARALARRVFEFSEFLVDELSVIDLGAECNESLAYHPSCHLLRDLGVDRQPMALLYAVKGLEVYRLGSECCGFGGVFSVDHAQISAQMLDRKLSEIKRSNTSRVVACDVSCLMQLEGGLRREDSQVRGAHLAQILAGEGGGLQ
ncbi:MAG: Fe-S oxidoreductase [Anaerolineales bacterium]|nr:Fe-S oxidoreductase [Anaerolineales bacterium]